MPRPPRKHTQRLEMRLDDELHRRLVALAERLDIPVSQIVRTAVREYVERANQP